MISASARTRPALSARFLVTENGLSTILEIFKSPMGQSADMREAKIVREIISFLATVQAADLTTDSMEVPSFLGFR